jgi:hypothetical protein
VCSKWCGQANESSESVRCEVAWHGMKWLSSLHELHDFRSSRCSPALFESSRQSGSVETIRTHQLHNINQKSSFLCELRSIDQLHPFVAMKKSPISVLIRMIGCLPLALPFPIFKSCQPPINQRKNFATSISSQNIGIIEVSDPISSSFYSEHKEEITQRMQQLSPSDNRNRQTGEEPKIKLRKPAAETPLYFVDVGTKLAFTSSFSFNRKHLKNGNSKKPKLMTTDSTPPFAEGTSAHSLLNDVKSIAASTAAMTVAAIQTKDPIPIEYLIKIEKRLEALESTVSSLSKQEGSKTPGSSSMQRQLDEIQGDLKELQDYETVTINWSIKDFEGRLRPTATTFTSGLFVVASFPMNLELRIDVPFDGEKRSVGFYIMHQNHKSKPRPVTPIYLGGTKLKIGNLERAFTDKAAIEQGHHGWGWDTFLTLDDLRENYIKKGRLQVRFTVRAKRCMEHNVDVAMISE